MAARKFVRELKGANIKDDITLLEFVKKYHKTERKSGIRSLQDYVVKLINDGINTATLKELFGVLNTVIPAVSKNSVTQDVFKNIRHAVIERFGKFDDEGEKTEMYEKSLSLMKFDLGTWRANKAEYIKKIAQANTEPKQYSFDDIKQVLRTTANGDDPIDLLIFLQLCVGSRFSELLHYSNFEKTDDKTTIKQVGILKGKDEKVRSVTKPVLFITPANFLTGFEKLRTLLQNEDNNLIQRKVNRRLKKLFNDKDASSHDLRKLYGDIAFKVYGGTSKDTAYIARVLGHAENSIGVSLSYLTVNVDLTDTDKTEIIERRIPTLEEVKRDVPVPKNINRRDGKAMNRLLLTISALKHNGEKITARKLKDFGYGQRVILEYMNDKENIV